MKPVHLWSLAAAGVLAIGAVRWPRSTDPPANMVACGADTDVFRATMRSRLEAMQAAIEAAADADADARIAAGQAGLALQIPTSCIVPDGWDAHASEQDRQWTRLTARHADESEVASALQALSASCIGCHQAHELKR